MRCPNCQATLRTVTYEGIAIETCPSCKGEWMDVKELGPIARAREVRFDEEERRAIAAAAKITGVEVAREDRDLVCPKCSGQTDAINYGGDIGIIIDRCTDCHGVWLDNGELERIQMLVEGWQDGLEGDLKKHSSRLHQIAQEADARDDVRVSRFGFVNSLINGILDVFA